MAFPDTDLDIIIRAYLGANPNDHPDDWPSPTDLSDRLLRRPIQITRGRRPGQKTAAAGSCVFWLDNTDGALTPLLATSQYYPHWDLGCPMTVSVDNVGTAPPYRRFGGFIADVTALMVPGVGGQNISAVRVTLAGLIRRLTQGSVAKSALFRTITGQNAMAPVAYWPMEDGETATQFASGLPDGLPMTGGAVNIFGGAPSGATDAISFADNALLPGSAPLPSFGETTYLRGDVPSYADTGMWISQMMFYLPTTLTSSNGAISEYWTGSTTLPVVLVDTNASSDPRTIRARVFQSDLITVAATLSLNFPVRDNVLGRWMSLAVTSASSNDLTMAILDTDGNILASGSVAVGAGFHARINRVFQRNVTSSDPGTGFGHSVVYTDTSWTTTVEGALYARAAGGYVGEQAHIRFERVCAEEGIVYLGAGSASVTMGPQPIADPMTVLRDCETVDHGMLIEHEFFGLDYRTSRQRENLPPSMIVDLSTYKTTAGTQADVLTPVRNDARIRNEWTVTRTGGVSATVKDETHQARHGRYNDSATINVETDDMIRDQAGWLLAEGTFNRLRYGDVPVDLGANE